MIFPVRINKFLAQKHNSTRKEADRMVMEKKVFINGRLAVLGDKVQATDVVEFRYRGKMPPAGSKPRSK